MPNPAFFRDAFTRFAVNDAIGDPNGLDAYGYIRVSSDVQAEESRTGLPRQIKPIHEIASEKGYRIPWTMLFADGESGFTLERPALEALIREIGGESRRGDVVFIEHLDRLSRDVDWHQGYLLNLFEKKYLMQVIFQKQFSSRVERVVIGAISQDGMERTKGVMKDGMREKAESVRATCKSKVAYGYRKVDGSGNVSDKTKRDTHDAINEVETVVMMTARERSYRLDENPAFGIKQALIKIAVSRIDAAYYGSLAGATDIIFHPGSYFGQPVDEVLERLIARLRTCVDDLRAACNPVILRPETMGKTVMLGSLEDCLRMSQEIEGVEPCLSFAHLHARAGDGTMSTPDEWRAVLDDYAKTLSEDSLQRLHIHLPIAKSDFNLEALFQFLHERGCAIAQEFP